MLKGIKKMKTEKTKKAIEKAIVDSCNDPCAHVVTLSELDKVADKAVERPWAYYIGSDGGAHSVQTFEDFQRFMDDPAAATLHKYKS
jgi:hypothetical protein